MPQQQKLFTRRKPRTASQQRKRRRPKCYRRAETLPEESYYSFYDPGPETEQPSITLLPEGEVKP